MGQRERLLEHLQAFCRSEDRLSRTFTLQEYQTYLRSEDGKGFSELGIVTRTREDVIRRLLQELRDRGELEFVDGRGTYTLQNCPLLDEQFDPGMEEFVLNEQNPLRREYFIETLSRDRRLVLAARDRFGTNCMIPFCQNSFVKDSGDLYVEVHHIQPLCEGGEDSLYNLSVVCAHHHRMAHFAEVELRDRVRGCLMGVNQELLRT